MRLHDFHRSQQLGCFENKLPIGYTDKLKHKIYSSIRPSYTTIANNQSFLTSNASNGGIFNLEFNETGNILIAAGERKEFIIYDSVTHKIVKQRTDAHGDCVNCVRFIDSRIFATCSDDMTVALWDIRNLNQKMRTLHGHSNWVKNIEFVKEDSLLVTSGFDGCIMKWDLNSPTETGLLSQRVLQTNGLMRMKLTSNCKKLILCTAGGYLMVIHDLDLMTLDQDLAGFKPNMYRLMQISQTQISMATSFSHLFTSKRNRIELISDFPNDAEVISALQVHPFDWCVVSRNTSNLEKSEFTVVHDIQDVPKFPEEDSVPRKRLKMNDESGPSMSVPTSTSSSSAGSQVELRLTAPLEWRAQTGGERPGFHLHLGEGDTRNRLSSNLEVRIPSEEVLQALESIREARSVESDFRVRNRLHQSNLILPNPAEVGVGTESSGEEVVVNWDHTDDARDDDNLTAHFVRAVADLAAQTVHLTNSFYRPSPNRSRRRLHVASPSNQNEIGDIPIHSNLSRITHFVEEANVGRGYIKELCFSPDGRVIASPFKNGVRLLSFNAQCSDMIYGLSTSRIEGSQCNKTQEPAHSLHALSTNSNSHQDIVVTTKFSPTSPFLFVSGCLSGKIVWHSPVL